MKKITLALLLCLLGFSPKVLAFDFTGMLPPPANPDPSYYTEVFGYRYTLSSQNYFEFCWVHDTSYKYLSWGYYYGVVYLQHTALQQNYILDKMTCFLQATPNYDHWIKGGDNQIPADGIPSDTYYYLTPQPGSVGDYVFSSFDLYATAPYARNFNGSYGLGVVQNGTFMMAANYDRLSMLTVSRDPEAGGGVASLPDGTNVDCDAEGSICCGVGGLNNCSGSFAYNADVLLAQFPNEGYTFDHWRINGIDYDDEIIGMAMIVGVNVKAVFAPIFDFPLHTECSGVPCTPYTAPISAVFDHSGSAQYSNPDYKTTAFSGETSDSQTPYTGTTCYPKSDSSYFGLGFNYQGISGAGIYYLCYSGHPGTDYPVGNPSTHVPVYAAADGIVHIPDSFPGYANAQTYNTIEIDHQNGYKTYYLHLYSQNVTENQQVYKSQTIIGYSGDTGSSGAHHLHFEVQKNGIPVDPYGWLGSGNDPYTRAINMNLWQ